MTLLALVIATGLVVDDAIIVIENIARFRAMGVGPRAAAVIGTRQIVFAVLSTTVTLIAVFVPISFMPVVVGNLFSVANVPGLSATLRPANSLDVRGGGQGLRFAVAGPNYARLAEVAQMLVSRLSETQGFRGARADYDTTQPQLAVRINRKAATKLGVPISTITSLINTIIDYQKAEDLFI